MKQENHVQNPNAEYNPEFVCSLFDRMSGSYENVNYITSFGFSLRWRKQFLRALPSSNASIQVIDLMTGMGETWGPVKKHFPNAAFSALDFSQGMLSHAKEKNRKQFNNSVTVLHQDLLKNTLASDHYDVVLSAFGLKTFNNDQIRILGKEIKRILRPGGAFSLIEVSAPSNILLRALYKFHLKYAVPICGKILLGNPEEYRMLWKYTDRFQNSSAAQQIFQEEGLDCKMVSYFNGCATGIVGRK